MLRVSPVPKIHAPHNQNGCKYPFIKAKTQVRESVARIEGPPGWDNSVNSTTTEEFLAQGNPLSSFRGGYPST